MTLRSFTPYVVLVAGLVACDITPSSSADTSKPTSTTASTSTPSGSSALPILATCTIKLGSRGLAECTEHYGLVPTMAADMCKGSEGTFSSSSTPCPEGSVGKCEFAAKAAGDPGETHFYYAGAVGDPKGSCEALGAVWTGTPHAASSAPAKSAAAPKATGAAPKHK